MLVHGGPLQAAVVAVQERAPAHAQGVHDVRQIAGRDLAFHPFKNSLRPKMIVIMVQVFQLEFHHLVWGLRGATFSNKTVALHTGQSRVNQSTNEPVVVNTRQVDDAFFDILRTLKYVEERLLVLLDITAGQMEVDRLTLLICLRF